MTNIKNLKRRVRELENKRNSDILIVIIEGIEKSFSFNLSKELNLNPDDYKHHRYKVFSGRDIYYNCNDLSEILKMLLEKGDRFISLPAITLDVEMEEQEEEQEEEE